MKIGSLINIMKQMYEVAWRKWQNEVLILIIIIMLILMILHMLRSMMTSLCYCSQNAALWPKNCQQVHTHSQEYLEILAELQNTGSTQDFILAPRTLTTKIIIMKLACIDEWKLRRQTLFWDAHHRTACTMSSSCERRPDVCRWDQPEKEQLLRMCFAFQGPCLC